MLRMLMLMMRMSILYLLYETVYRQMAPCVVAVVVGNAFANIA
jgi:hypothetical protein